MKYNEEHGIIPKTIVKDIRDILEISSEVCAKDKNGVKLTEKEKNSLIVQLEKQMKKAAEMLEFEIAAQLRDEIIRLKGKE